MADGLDGSGSHIIYNQISSNTSTKNYILFCFKPISITTNSGQIAWQNPSPNSSFAQRPVFLCAARECEQTIRTFMDELINEDTENMKQLGIDLSNGEHVNIDIIRSMFDGKCQRYFPELGEQVVNCAPQLIKILKIVNTWFKDSP